MPYPPTSSEQARFVLERRGPKHPLDPSRPYGVFVEEERDSSGDVVPVAAILLTNRECPWKCVFCDLWRNTLDESVDADHILAQTRLGLESCPGARWIKLYNAGSFFDPRAIPPDSIPTIADLLARFERVIVESHPALVLRENGSRVVRLRDALRDSLGASRGGSSARLEVAMGLETVYPLSLERLNKGMTLDDFARAARILRRSEVDLRAFVLVQPPFTPPEESVHWALRSVEFARDQGARSVALIPTRGGNGALEALRDSGDFVPPRLATLEDALDRALELTAPRGTPVVAADLWDLERFSDCPACFPAREARLRRMNLAQRVEPRVPCGCARR